MRQKHQDRRRQGSIKVKFENEASKSSLTVKHQYKANEKEAFKLNMRLKH